MAGTSGASPFRGGSTQMTWSRTRSGVAAEKLDVFDSIAAGVFPGVGDGLGDDLRPNDPPGPPRQGQRDRPDAAVQVQHGLLPGKPGKPQSQTVQALRLSPVDLEEGGGGQTEGQSAQLLLQPALPPKLGILISENYVGIPGVGVEDHPSQPGLRLTQSVHQRLRLGQGPPVDYHADQTLPIPVGADIEVPDQSPARPLVIGGDAVRLHPRLEGPLQAGDRLRLEEAVRGVQHIVAPGAEVADGQPPPPLSHRELYLVPVPVGLFRPQDRGQIQVNMSHPLQGVGNALALGPQLLGVGHVPVLTAAAFPIQGAVNPHPLRGGGQQLHSPAPGHIFFNLFQPDPPPLPGDGAGHKDNPALQPGHPHPLGGEAGDL